MQSFANFLILIFLCIFDIICIITCIVSNLPLKPACFCVGVALRLVGGNSYNEGRVEINYNGEWGTVCDNGWSYSDARVVCRQLGFGSSGTAIGSAGFGQGSGPIWLDGVACNGSESTLAECSHLGVGVTRSCSHSEDAGVRCSLQGQL